MTDRIQTNVVVSQKTIELATENFRGNGYVIKVGTRQSVVFREQDIQLAISLMISGRLSRQS